MNPAEFYLSPAEAFELAADIVCASEELKTVALELSTTTDAAGNRIAKRGRQADVQPQAILVGLVVSLLVQHRIEVKYAWACLTTFSLAQKKRIGFGRTYGSNGQHRNPGYTTFHNALTRLRKHLEISHHAGLAPADRDANHDALERLAFDLLAVSVKDAPDHNGRFSVDGVVLPAYTSPFKADAQSVLGTTPDAAWFKKKNGRGEEVAILGFEVHPLINYTEVESGMPRLIHGIAVTTSGDPRTRGRAAASMVERLVANGVGVTHFVADRGYSMAKTTDYLDRLFGAGVRPYHDLSKHDRGHNGSDPRLGIQWVDGSPFGPCLPNTKPYTDVGAIPAYDDETGRARHRAKVETREPFRAAPLTRIAEDGSQRVQCPAEAGKVRCPLKPESMKLPKSIPTVKHHPAPGNLPKICQQKTVVAPAGGGRGRQPEVWASEKWAAEYSPGRSASERLNWDLTRLRNENLAYRGVHQIRGYTSHYLAFLCAALAYNARTLRHFRLAGPVVTKTKPKPKPTHATIATKSTPVRRTKSSTGPPRTRA